MRHQRQLVDRLQCPGGFRERLICIAVIANDALSSNRRKPLALGAPGLRVFRRSARGPRDTERSPSLEGGPRGFGDHGETIRGPRIVVAEPRKLIRIDAHDLAHPMDGAGRSVIDCCDPGA